MIGNIDKRLTDTANFYDKPRNLSVAYLFNCFLLYFECITAISWKLMALTNQSPGQIFFSEPAVAKMHFLTQFLQQLCTLYSCEQLKHSLDTKY